MSLVAIVAMSLVFWGGAARAQDGPVRLEAPIELVDSGLFKFILPRFTLKHRVRVEVVAEGGMAALGRSEGAAVFADGQGNWHLTVAAADHRGAIKFADWLRSDVGQRTVLSFAPDGVALFSAPTAAEIAEEDSIAEGSTEVGQALALTHCGRCHVVSDANRMNAIGSTPSFAVLRTFPDWEGRFQAFFALKPHGAFTQIEDVTDPFPEDRPSPIVPVEMTLEDLENILAFVAAMAPADLGQPLQLK